jgi:His-Xaa-Ser system radical SAM maturase HxsB
LNYSPVTLPFRFRSLSDSTVLAVSSTGDFTFLSAQELIWLQTSPESIPLDRQAQLRAKFFIGSRENRTGQQRLIKSRIAAKRETVIKGPSLHIIVPTAHCAHSCKYCQVSRSLDEQGYTMSLSDLDAACDTIFQSRSKALTVEFQGGDPLLRFDLVRHAILRITARNAVEGRIVRFVIASSLHQLTAEMCAFFKAHAVLLSTSVDGPLELHNRNRPTATRDAYQRTVSGIELARNELGPDSVSALMTTTKDSLTQPEAIVDEYVKLGLSAIFLRPLSSYGFAKRNQALLGYSLEQYADFYERGLNRVLYWNRQGVELREVYTSIILNKLLSTFDNGYVDLQSPTGSGTSVLVYNHDGFVYPSDEARMLSAMGDHSLRMGRIGNSMTDLLESSVASDLVSASLTENNPVCMNCTYNLFCAPNPVDAHAQHGNRFAMPSDTEHCKRHLWLFDQAYIRIRDANEETLTTFYRWAAPHSTQDI